MLSTVVPMPLDALQQQLLSMDTDASRFGVLFCTRLGYTQLQAGSWDGNETEGLTRTVRLVVKCPPKPMLPDSTRVVIRHRLARLLSGALVLEREVSTLDVPYGEAFSLQERWVATPGELAAADADSDSDDEGEGEGATHSHLSVRCHVHFRSRVNVMASKIRHHSVKGSRKVAALAVELLAQAQTELVRVGLLGLGLGLGSGLGLGLGSGLGCR